MRSIVFCVLFLVSKYDASPCNDACHKTNQQKLNIHMVPHTHDDVGWVKTIDQYYYGSEKFRSIPFGVQYIIDSVITELDKNPDRRFVFVESAFFWRWWADSDNHTREIVRTLVFERRLEFLLGGWCMNDEATPHYSAMIDQMTLGLKFLNDTFGECARPTAAWQIDPFGHSSEVAIEFAEMGFEGLFLGRIDHEDIANRKHFKTMEMVWRSDTSLGEAGDLFTSVLYRRYIPPPGFCFDVFCGDDPIIDDETSHDYNLYEKIKEFENHMKIYQKAYKTNHIIVTMGDDFMYSSASSWYKNIDKMIKYINKSSKSLHLLYSTPSCYLQAINSLNISWPLKVSDDFFPYGSDEHSYWTGFYTSRPSFKYYVYLANNVLQATKKLATILIGNELDDEEFDFKNAVSTVQHHDAVSGTEQQHVTNDYGTYLAKGLEAGQKIFTRAYRKLYNSTYPEQLFGNLRNISQFEISENDENFAITVYNQLPHTMTTPIRFPVIDREYKIFDKNGVPIDYDCFPIPMNLQRLPGRKSKATHDIVFIANHIPPLGVTNFYVQKTLSTPYSISRRSNIIMEGSNVLLDNGKIQLTFNKTDGLLYSVTKNNITYPFHQNFFFYTPFYGTNDEPVERSSGAYVFRPTAQESRVLFKNAVITEFKGVNIFEVHQQFSSWLSQVVRLYKNSEDIEFQWLVGPIPISSYKGKEIVSKYFTNVASASTFYTDSNGRRWIKRVRDRRRYWNTTVTEPVASNYYPVTTAACIKDGAQQVTVIVDRPAGCTSMENGELEIMLHRRILSDDGFGVSEPLNEHVFGAGLVVRGTHLVQIVKRDAANDAHRLKTTESVYSAVVTFGQTSYTLREWLTNFGNSFSLLTFELPPNVHILTLERWREHEILVRFEHLFQHGESANYSHPVLINIKKIFQYFDVIRYEELTLAANIRKEKLKRMQWNVGTKMYNTEPNYDNNIITLHPMQIRTFLLYIQKLK